MTDMYKVITKTNETLTLRGLEDRKGKYLFINNEKVYFLTYNPICNVSNSMIKSMKRVCSKCYNVIHFTNGLQCTHTNCGI